MNVGPNAKGEIPKESLERLAAIGAWMKENGASITDAARQVFLSRIWAGLPEMETNCTIICLKIPLALCLFQVSAKKKWIISVIWQAVRKCLFPPAG